MSGTAPTRARTVPDGREAGVPPIARRIPLPPGVPIDPFALAGDDGILISEGGRVLVGIGVARTIPLSGGLADPDGVDRALGQLASLVCDDLLAGGTSPLAPILAFGALPFDRTAGAVLLVPATLYCREPDGTEWVTVVDGLDEHPGALRDRLVATAEVAAVSAGSGAAVTRVTPRTSDAEFEAGVTAAVQAIERGDVTKVVLARRVEVELDRVPDIAGLLRRWRSLEPNGTLFSLPTEHGRFVGASPELLVERTGDHVRSWPLAGTTDRFRDDDSPLPAALMDSAKDAEEHRLVVDAIRRALEPHCVALEVPEGPELVHLHNLTHLGTTIDGTLASPPGRPVPSALHLAALLHPTPAVCGVPREAALALIGQLEDGGRGPYAGPVGYLDGRGDGRFVIGIRALALDGTTATMSAGVGVVAGSRPEVERDETIKKFRAVFDALAPGVHFTTSDPAT